MTELPIHHLIEHSIQIAWDYLERTGELDDPEIAGSAVNSTLCLGDRGWNFGYRSAE
jgi:hypothetical protein